MKNDSMRTRYWENHTIFYAHVHACGPSYTDEEWKTFGRIRNSEPYYKCKLELKSNSSEILPVSCKFICNYIPI